jgi:hypothetical protein
MMSTKRIVYVCRYALAEGIWERESEPVQDSGYVRVPEGRCYYEFKLDEDVFYSLDKAKAHAVILARKKVQSTRRQLQRAEERLKRFEQGDIPISELAEQGARSR